MSKLKGSIYLKIGAIVVISLLLLIPTSMISGLISERENTKNEAINEVSDKWSREQTIVGPIISVPYYRYVKESGSRDTVARLVRVKDYIHFLPTALNIEGSISPQMRYRGIYEVVVYDSKLRLHGTFADINFATLDIPKQNILFNQAEFVLGISDLRGLEEQIELLWCADTLQFNPGVSSNDVVESGINAQVSLSPDAPTSMGFDLTLNLKGSQTLYFTPVGRTTDVSIASSWRNPSFNGAFLPDSRSVSDTGFCAKWNVLHLNRNYPQMWLGARYAPSESSFGINLLLPVDSYQKSYRAIRYAILFIGFTFLVFFFIEVLGRVGIHPIQYALVGVALIVFYSLLLAISEYLAFNVAFVVSALATLALIAAYVRAILKSNIFMLLVVGILAILYTFIFVIIQLQDYALLIGSIGIFIILALVMFFSRKIDWYNLSLDKTEKK